MHASPGAGKTLGALLGFQAMQKEGLLTNFVVFCHRHTIADQWEKTCEMLNLKVKNFEVCSDIKERSSQSDGWIVTYQSASRNLQKIKEELSVSSTKGLIAIADEAHHLVVSTEEPEGAVWGKTFLAITKHSSIRLGLTGTPFRADNLPFCAARKVLIHSEGEVLEQINPDLCVEPRELISVGDVRPLEFHFQDGWVEHSYQGNPDREVSPISSETRESWRARNLRKAINLSDSNGIAVQIILKARKKLISIRETHAKAAGLVIAKDISHAKAIAKLLKEKGDSVELVHSQEKEASNRLSTFKDSTVNWLVSIDMCSEGFDAPRIRVVLYLTTVVTKSRFLQGITRAVRMSSERESLEAIPRDPSHIYSPADPLLIEYAHNWSETKPYLIKGNKSEDKIDSASWISKGATLPMEAVDQGIGNLIRIRTAELPQFLKR